MVKYWRGNISVNLVNDSQLTQFTKILPNQSLPFKYFECRGELIGQFITAKSLVSIHSPIFCPSNILPHTLVSQYILECLKSLTPFSCLHIFKFNWLKYQAQP